ncbi:MAG: NAD(+)/NADH kinase [Chromatiales bacterium]|nr:NAD(+)/NADH kinase [Chromatiales bacterium]
MSSPSPKRFPVVGLMGNHQEPRVAGSLRLLASHLHLRDRQVMVPETFPAGELADPVHRLPESELATACTLLVTVGGDGSMLYAARRAAGSDTPLLGINRGRLGFLTDISPEQMLDSLDSVLAGDYVTEHRMMLEARLEGGHEQRSGLAFNDIVIKRHDETGRMFDCQTWVDGTYVNTHAGDGLVIASPTGSTAYALSCGGPIVEPGLQAIVLTPICPHTLSDRPLVIAAHRQIEVRLPAGYPDAAAVSCDGNILGRLTAGERLCVATAGDRVTLLHPPGYDYFEILRGKLHWGGDPRERGGRNSPER